MKYSKLFGKAVKESLRGMESASADLLYRGGFIRDSVAGRYFMLPLGQAVQNKIVSIIREEMNKSGAQEMLSPVLHPLELWQETNRTNTAGFELMKVKDRRDAEFALGGTAEEMFVDVVRKFQISYKDLPFNIYQFSLKFRDELRARGGLLRVREFLMKDAYSFDADEQAFISTYQLMSDVYRQIFLRLGLDTYRVEADNGYIGGEYCHEYVVESEAGESRFFVTPDNSYSAHEDVARFKRDQKNLDEDLEEYREIEAKRGTTMEDGVNFHKLPLWRQIKDFMAVDDKGRLILAVIRGDYNINELKLAHVVGASTLRHATEEEIRKLGSEPGFISPVGMKGKVLIVGDLSLRTIKNAYGGANKKHLDALNMNIDRDYTLDIEADIAMAQAGFTSENGQTLVERKGIEVGNVFQLGYHYSRLMSGAEYTDDKGNKQQYYMGSYGIGIGRTMAAVVEKFHDDKGIVWPKTISPFAVHLIGLNGKGEDIYNQLSAAGVEVLFDDTSKTAGQKFADADLIGIPVRLVVSDKTGDRVEWKDRVGDKTELLGIDEVVKKLLA